MKTRDFAVARRHLIERIIEPAGVTDKRVLRAMSRIPRHCFVGEALALQAYLDNSLPIGNKQTISKPTAVAKMLEALHLKVHERVLEVGTGSGYQTALLSCLVRRVFSVEIFEDFVERAQRVLAALDCCNVSVRMAGKVLGLPEEGPFDAIVVSACGAEVPQELVDQLSADGGRLIAPVWRGQEQRLRLITRQRRRRTERDLGPCSFVPLLGEFPGRQISPLS